LRIGGRAALPNDVAIRTALRARLRAARRADVDAVVLEELGLCRGRVRIDLAVVDGTLHGYEIKSDRDSLRRLSEQVEVCGKVFDRATLVTGCSHLWNALRLLPEWWAVLLVQATSRGVHFKTVRRGRRNASRDPRALVELLWLDDAMALLDRREATCGVRGKPRRVVWDRICQCLDLDEIAAAVRSHLKARAVSPTPSQQS
jgi:hypothetical protein